MRTETSLVRQIDPLPRATTSIRKLPNRFKQLKHMIGNTPLLAIRFLFRGKKRVIYAKAEQLNMTGSIKDRMAFHILKRAYQEGCIQPGDTIAEATSGNTGISFAAIGRALGHQVVIFLRERNPQIKLHPLQPAESPTLSTGHKVGHHRIQGISDEFIPSILQLHHLDPVVSVHDGDAILMAQKLAAGLGLGVGISSGANFIGALITQNELGDDAVVTTVFPDDNKKYLSTDLLLEERVQDNYLTPEVELLGYEAIKRVCYTCFDDE